MNKQHQTYYLFPIAAFVMVAFVLILMFVPDMSTTLIDTVPEYPPELNTIDESQQLVSDTIHVDKSNVKNLVAAINRPAEYFIETKSVLTHQSGSATYLRKRWVKGSFSRVDFIDSSVLTSAHYIYTTDSVYVWEPGSTTYYKTAKGAFEPDDAQMMMTYEDIINAPDESIAAAELTMYDGVSCIYAEVKNLESGYTERYWVSTSTGLLIHGQTLDASGNEVYSITATQTDVSTQSTEFFKLPDGSFPAEE